MKNFTTPRFWPHYHYLSPEIRKHADRSFALFQRDPQHPSLQFQKKGLAWVARVGPGHRALAKERPEGLVWFWIGPHDEYERLLRSLEGPMQRGKAMKKLKNGWVQGSVQEFLELSDADMAYI